MASVNEKTQTRCFPSYSICYCGASARPARIPRTSPGRFYDRARKCTCLAELPGYLHSTDCLVDFFPLGSGTTIFLFPHRLSS